MGDAMTDGSRSRVSAGLLRFRRKDRVLEVLLVHPGGPFFQHKDEGAWTTPKGEASPGEDLLARAQTEFEEELGIRPSACAKTPDSALRASTDKTAARS